MDIYIKPVQKAVVTGRKVVYLKDIADVYVSGGKNQDLDTMIVLKITGDKKENYLISVMDVIKTINNHLPDATVSNVGEMDVIVEYSPVEKKQSTLFLYAKIAFVFIVLMAGASTAIMSFHSDAQMPKIFENYYYIFFRQNVDMPSIIAIPYSIGLAVGIIVFFNHFSKIYITKDPTPIEVQMTTYEKETVANIVDTLSSKNKQEKSGGKT